MQIPDDPFEVNALYSKAIEDIANNKLKSKTKTELLYMRLIFVAHHELNKSFSTSQPYMLMVDSEISKKESARDNRILFWAAIIAAIFAVIASWPILQGWIPTFRREGKAANSPLPKSSSTLPLEPSKPPAPDAGGTNH